MNFQELNYALSIARYQNLTKAAEELYISQPTLSKCLQKLEREMGGKLFSRSGNTYVPTYLGRRYLEYARKVLALNQDWERELKDMNACMDGWRIEYRFSSDAQFLYGTFYYEGVS